MAAKIATEKLDGSKNSHIQAAEMNSRISAYDEQPHDSRSSHLVVRIAACTVGIESQGKHSAAHAKCLASV